MSSLDPKNHPHPVTARKKLIEVALPLEAINKASAREKSIRHGHPSTLHLWWARRPLAAARAVIFSQMVDDPSEYTDVLLSDPVKKRAAERELRKREQEAGTGARSRKREAGTEDGAPVASDSSLPASEVAASRSSLPASDLAEVAADIERQRLFRIIEDLVLWENTTNEEVLDRAREEIWQSWRRACAENVDHPRAKELFDRHKLPAFHDPFAGGGSLPLEAQRLGLEAYASDLNPVAVLINKAMIEIPPKFAGREPVNPEWQAKSPEEKAMRHWKGAQGLADDVRYYGQWMRDEAEKRIGHLYPKVEVTAEMVVERPDLKSYLGQKLTVIAWLWARTVRSPNPAYSNLHVPLVSSFMLSTKQGKEAYIEPVIDGNEYHFTVKAGSPPNMEEARCGTKLSQGSFRCLLSNTPFRYDYIDDEANEGRMSRRLMAVVAEGLRGRVYLAPTRDLEASALTVHPAWKPDAPSRGTWGSNAQGRRYGFETFGDYFTPRQLAALTTFSDLVQEASEPVRVGALAMNRSDDHRRLDNDGTGPNAYADAVATYLAFAVDKCSDYWSSVCSWHSSGEKMRNTFGRQGIAMAWDYAEANPFCDSSGNWMAMVNWTWKAIEPMPGKSAGFALQADAQSQELSAGRVVSTDPPYYDNIGYADLSDFFYVWLRRALRSISPHLFATLAVPKAEELVAEAYRHGSRQKAEAFFLGGMTKAMNQLAVLAMPAFPVTIYYAFKQAENDGADGIASTGWDTFLDAVIRSGFAITGTWPIRTELSNKLIGTSANMLASSIVLVCRRADAGATTLTRRDFLNALRSELPAALSHLQRGNIAPVDLAQAAIGPGMAIYTRHSKVLDAEGTPLSVRDALALINQSLDEVLAAQEGDFDADTRWALAWFEQFGFAEGEYGVAETLSKAKNTSVGGMEEAGIVKSGSGKVRLLRPSELPEDWNPDRDERLTVWEMVHHLIRVLGAGGEGAASKLVASLGAKAEVARELAYRLYTLCERKKRAAEALSYNGLVQSWPEISRLARSREQGAGSGKQAELFEE